MARLTRIRIEVDDATLRWLQQEGATERRPTVDQAAVILARCARRAHTRDLRAERVVKGSGGENEGV